MRLIRTIGACALAIGLSGAPAALGNVRLFMSADGEQAIQPLTGNTSVSLQAGTSKKIIVWIQDTTGSESFNGYQVIIPWNATIVSGAGTVRYVDIAPTGSAGNTVLVNTTRPDWVFAGVSFNPTFYQEVVNNRFGFIHNLAFGVGTNIGALGIRYVGEFSIEALAGTCGEFELPFRLSPPPATQMFLPMGGTFTVNEFQKLRIGIGPQNDDCADATPVTLGVNPLCVPFTDVNPDVWFNFTPTCSGEVTVSTCDRANFDTQIEVYQGCTTCPPPGGPIAANNDGAGCSGGTSELQYNGVAGTCYRIRVTGTGAGLIGTGSLFIFSNSCLIDSICRSDGQINPTNECQVCDPDTSVVAWSSVANGAACTSDGNVCTFDQCNGAGACGHPPVGSGAPCPDDGLECTLDQCNGSGGCGHPPVGAGTPCTSDDNVCTIDECNGSGVCAHPGTTAGSTCDDGLACTGTGAPGVGVDGCDGNGNCVGNLDPNCQDRCANAADAFEGATLGNNTGFDTELQVSCAINSEHDAWFVHHPLCSGQLKINTVGSSFDTVLTVFDECGGSEIACDDDGAPGAASTITIPVVAGEDYFIRVAGFQQAVGDIVLNISRVDVCLIDGICRPDGTFNPDNSCEVCTPILSTGDWSAVVKGTACGNQTPTDLECDAPDACDGLGTCDPNHKPNGLACGDPTNTQCDNPDTCNGLGMCVDNFETPGFACGDPTDTDCDNPDTCDGSGTCLDNLESVGFPCGDQSDSACDHPDTCDGNANCLINYEPDGTACPNGLYCDGDETCLSGLCVDNADPCVDLPHCDETNNVCLECLNTTECGDNDPVNGIVDNNCLWYDCAMNVCNEVARVFGDMGGAAGACPLDGTADSNDKFHALLCFANLSTTGMPPYPCEPVNIDVAGPGQSCCPDGACDANDAFAALNAFSGLSSCSCPLDPGGTQSCPPSGGPAPIETPVATGSATISVAVEQRVAGPNDLVSVHVFMDDAQGDLRGYQLHLGVSGGRRGQLELVDISIEPRRDGVFADAQSWTAFNVARGQMLAGLDGAGVPTTAKGYLATYTYRVSPDAAGAFVIDVLGHDSARPNHRTFLFASGQGTIALEHTKPAVLVVASRTAVGLR